MARGAGGAPKSASSTGDSGGVKGGAVRVPAGDGETKGVRGHRRTDERTRVRDPGSLLPDPGHPRHHGRPPLRDGLSLLQAPREEGGAGPPPGAPSPRHHPAADLQRDVRARPAARVGGADPLPARAAADPGPRRLDRRDDRDRQPRRRTLSRARLRHAVPAPHRPHRLQGRRPRRGPAERDGRVRPHLRRRLRRPAGRPREDDRLLPGPAGRHGAGPLGPHQPRLLAPHRGAVDHARRALHHGARCPQPLRPLLQLQRHRRASGAAR